VVNILKIFTSTILSLSLSLSLNAIAEENSEQRYSLGLGFGSAYSGVGANFASISQHEMKYISAGCTKISSSHSSTCGFGLGWIKTDLFDVDNDKHGIGIYIGKVDEETEAIYNQDIYTTKKQDVYGAGISYTYFKDGLLASDLNYGVSFHVTNAEYDDNHGWYFQLGYQF
tara:strand:- start:630 stop:1142 length:513 start_codon:yes stop_codon:yes gene_type:complete